MTNTTIIIRKSLADEVAATIKEQILTGKLRVDEQLPTEAVLGKTYGVGRSTIREAIKLLVNSGLLRVQQGVGMFVEDNKGIKEPFIQRLQRANNEDLDEVRKILEMKIAEKAAANRTNADIQKMKRCLETRAKAAAENNLLLCVEADINFHIAIAAAAKNEILSELYQTFATQLKKYFLEEYTSTEKFKKTATQHEQLLKSIIDKDAKKAWKAAAIILGHLG